MLSEESPDNVPLENHAIILDYKNCMGVLLGYLHSLGHEWHHYINAQERFSDSVRKSVSVS